MQYKFFASAALAATAFAQVDGTAEQSSQAAELLSVVSVLQTALPSSLIQEALTNSAGVSSELASEFAAGQTPSWFTALPSDVQTYLVPAIVDATAVTSASGAPHPSANSTSGNTTSIILTTRVTSSSSSSSSETGASATGSSSDSSSSSSEAGAMPTAVLGAGLAGAVGIVGLLAL